MSSLHISHQCKMIYNLDKLAKRALRKLAKKNGSTAVDIEWAMAALLCHRDRVSIDVGADFGNFASTVAPYSSSCIAFEPRALQALQIAQRFALEKINVEVQPVALSNKAGVSEMRILVNDPGRSTIDSSNDLFDPDGSSTKIVRVPVMRLDDYSFQNVGLLKIDVEGHEIAVLEGGIETVSRFKPSVYIEVEERHNPGATSAVREFLNRLDYEGFFVLDRKLQPVEYFDPLKHQNAANIGGWKAGWEKYGIYINNFFYLPRGHCADFVAKAQRAGLLQ